MVSMVSFLEVTTQKIENQDCNNCKLAANFFLSCLCVGYSVTKIA